MMMLIFRKEYLRGLFVENGDIPIELLTKIVYITVFVVLIIDLLFRLYAGMHAIREVYDMQNSFNVPYLNNNMRMINCSRDALQPLKFWWLIQKVGYEGWSQQAEGMMESTAYLDEKLTEIGWPHWVNDYSNTVFFKRPSQTIIDKYLLAGGYDERFGGELSHVVVMQQVNKEAIDMFVAELKNEM